MLNFLLTGPDILIDSSMMNLNLWSHFLHTLNAHNVKYGILHQFFIPFICLLLPGVRTATGPQASLLAASANA